MTAGLLAACSGGGSGTTLNGTVPESQAPAMVNVTVVSPPLNSAANTRQPAYVSASTTHATLWIDGATSIGAGRTSCTSSGVGTTTCAWSNVPTTSGVSHNFQVETDDGVNVLAQGFLYKTLVPGSNTAAVVLNGVAASATLSGETCSAEQCTGTLVVSDADGRTIIQPGNFDNAAGGIVFETSASGEGSFTASPSTTIPAASNTYTAACTATDGGTFTVKATVTPSEPSGSNSNGEFTNTDLTGGSPNLGLTYPAFSTINGFTYTCNSNSTITDSVTTITVTSHLRT